MEVPKKNTRNAREKNLTDNKPFKNCKFYIFHTILLPSLTQQHCIMLLTLKDSLVTSF